MDRHMQDVWTNIYGAFVAIGDFEPWDDLMEDDIFMYFPPDSETPILYSFYGERLEMCGVAIYFGLDDYLDMRCLYADKKRAKEPRAFLQNAYFGIWGDSSDLTKREKETIKELGFKFRGNGGWPFFRKHEVARFPTELNDEESEKLLDALGNLHMMLKAYRTMKIDSAEFANNKMFVRYFNNETGLYNNGMIPCNLKVDMKERYYVTINFSDDLKTIINKPIINETLKISIAYAGRYIEDNGEKMFPLILTIKTNAGVTLALKLFSQNEDWRTELYGWLLDFCEKNGRPQKIISNNKMLYYSLKNLCNELGMVLK